MLGRIAGLLSLLGIGLYFTGWIYRWAYFGYFQLEVTTLDLPFESFLIVPIQVFFGNISSGDFSTIWRSIWIAIATFIVIIISFKIIQFFTQELANIINQIISSLLRITLKTKHHRINRTLLLFPNFQPVNDEKYDKVLINEIVIVTWLLTALFFLGQSQGKVDAIRDSRNETSFLPVVTLITPENQLPLGRKVDDIGDDPNVGSFRIIGDLELSGL
ncbi:MAG: hypothetical protein SWX82_09545 [Cyanobacteriota bacterium]|nr:hypothetical protein [Cyanobacteriota bacterium]